jgi:hypothetical protein
MRPIDPRVKLMHLSSDVPAPGYPGMAGTCIHDSRGVDLVFCPGGPGIYRGLSGEFTLAKEPGFGAGNLAGIKPGFAMEMVVSCRAISAN